MERLQANKKLLATIIALVAGLALLFIGGYRAEEWHNLVKWFGVGCIALGLILLIIFFTPKEKDEEPNPSRSIWPDLDAVERMPRETKADRVAAIRALRRIERCATVDGQTMSDEFKDRIRLLRSQL